MPPLSNQGRARVRGRLNTVGALRSHGRRLRAELEFRLLASPLLGKSGTGPDAGKSIVVVGSAHKVGSTWLYELVRDAGGYREGLPWSLADSGTLALEHPRAMAYLGSLRGRRIFKTHSFPPASAAPGTRWVTMLRDPRDVLVSSAFFLAWLPPSQGGWGRAFADLDMAGRIHQLIERGDFILERLARWHGCGHAYQARYERFLADTPRELRRLLDWLGIDVTDERIESAVEAHSFARKAGRGRGEEDARSFFRKGVSGDWRNHFDARATDLFQTALEGRWNRLLLDLGYETEPRWHGGRDPAGGGRG